MDLNDKVTQLEDEIKILKNEVQAVLLDLRETCLNRENPLNPDVSSSLMTIQPIIVNQPPPIPAKEEEPDGTIPGENQESELPVVKKPVNEPEPAVNEPEPVYKPESIASEETVHEEVKRAWRPEIETGCHFEPMGTINGVNQKVDLTAITGLAQWVAETVQRLGGKRTKAILDIFEMMGHVAPELNSILVKFINSTSDESSGKATTRDYLAALIDLDRLLGRDDKSEIALLYMLCQENDSG